MKITHNKVGQNVNLVDGAKSDKAGAAKGAKETALSKLGEGTTVSALRDHDSATKVDVSDRAQEAKRIKDLAMAAPDVDMAKVEKFRNLIESGKYSVDARAVADRMVEEHLNDDQMETKN